uniref:Uncharacterized protein LOC113799813 n=1 Tax=Dermatophagoides pteronyssinus TaxID=6956 RepID=A0A6P6YMN5_DERPT
MYSIVKFEINIWKKFMQNKYYHIVHNHIFYLFNYNDELIRQKPMGKISKSYKLNLLLGIINLLVLFTSIIMIIKPKWINNFNTFNVLLQMFPAEGLSYLIAAMIICTINSLLNAFYATSTDYNQFEFILPIQYSKYRNLNELDSNRFEWI